MSTTSHQSEKYAFEPFGTLDGVLQGEPIRIFPQGVWYRDTRVLDLQPARLQEFARNIKQGLPRFEVPINIEHDHALGRYGSVHDLEYIEDGPDGPGLYATKYEFTPEGQKLIADQKFKGVSGESVWTLNGGALYQDPRTGDEFDNVLVGLALTNSSFFGKEVALFSANVPAGTTGQPELASAPAQAEATNPAPDLAGVLSDLRDLLARLLQGMNPMTPAMEMPEMEPEMEHDASEADAFKQYDAEQRREMAAKGQALPDGSYPIADQQDLQDAIHALGRGKNNSHPQIKAHIIKRAQALGATDLLPADWEGSTKENATTPLKEVDKMADEQTKPEEFSVKPEDFKALMEKAAQLEQLQEQMSAQKAQAEELKAKLAQTEYDRDLDRMVKYAEGFLALPVKAEDLGKKLLDLKRKDPELFGYFDGLLKTTDQLLTQADLFGQHGTRRAPTEETFEGVIDQVLAEKFGNDPGKYSEAMQIARERRPDLMTAYLNQPRSVSR